MKVLYFLIAFLLISPVTSFATNKNLNLTKKSAAPNQYLVFEMTNVTNLDQKVKELQSILGKNQKKSTRFYAFGVNCIPYITRSIENLKNIIKEGFDIAEKYNVPVMFHIDPMYGFGAYTKFEKGEKNELPEIKYWENPDMCEWVDFPKKGEKYGRVPRSWLNWGSWLSPAPAVPCFASPKLKKFMVTQLENGVVETIVKRYKKLEKQNKEYLFVGLNVAWETHIPDHSYCLNEKNPIVSMHSDKVIMEKWEMAKTGFAALHHKGWNDKKLAKEAKKQKITTNELFFNLCSEVIHNYMELLAKTAFDGGISKNKIFTHIVPTHSVMPNPQSTFRPPVWTAVNNYSIPGFTMCIENGARYDIKDLKKRIKKANSSQNKFAAVETYVRFKKTEKSCTKYLNSFFDNGSPIMCIYGALGGGGYEMNSKPVNETLAIKKWLNKR